MKKYEKSYLLGVNEGGKEYYVAMYNRQAYYEQFYLTEDKNKSCKFLAEKELKKEEILKYFGEGKYDNLLDLLEGKDLIVKEVA